MLAAIVKQPPEVFGGVADSGISPVNHPCESAARSIAEEMAGKGVVVHKRRLECRVGSFIAQVFPQAVYLLPPFFADALLYYLCGIATEPRMNPPPFFRRKPRHTTRGRTF